MVSLPTPDIVLKVATGPDGVIEGKKVRRFVDLSTTGSVMAQRIFKLLAANNIVQIDAPVSGGVRGAAKGTRRRHGVGPARRRRGGRAGAQGDRQILFHRRAVGRRADHEALQQRAVRRRHARRRPKSMVMGVKAGLDPRIMLDVINASSGRSTATEQKFPDAVLPAHLQSGLHRRPDEEGRESLRFRGQSARRADQCDRGGRRRCSSSPATSSVRTRTSPRSSSRSRSAPASRCGKPVRDNR